jgi:predicted double-glycine peptidase
MSGRWAPAIGLIACSVVASCATPHRAELGVPDVRQSTDYTCSASALQAVLAYYGIEAREDELSKELGATPEDGAPPDAIARVARAHGLHAEVRDNMTVEDLAAELAQRRPVIVDLQAWSDVPRTDWTDAWEDGHYVIVIAIEGDRLVFEDPSLLGSRAVLTRRELEQRWHDVDAARRHLRTGILVGGKPPAPPPPRARME